MRLPNWGSGWGSTILSAVCARIPRTSRAVKRGDYTDTFGGTSSATSVVAGVAALVLLANLCRRALGLLLC